MMLSDELYEIGSGASKHYIHQENGLIGHSMWQACVNRMSLSAKDCKDDSLFLTSIRRCKLAWINAIDRLQKDGNNLFKHTGFEYMWNKMFANDLGYKFIYGVFTKIKS